MTCLTKYAMRVTACFCRLFYRLGKLVAKYPFPFVILPVLIFSTLGVFFYFADRHSNVEDMYTPINSRGHKEKIRVKSLFKDGADENFNAMALNDNQLGIGIILQQRNRSNILTEASLDVIHDVAEQIKNITMIIDVEIVVPKSTLDISTLGLNTTSEGLVTSDNYVTLKQYESGNDRSGLADDVKVMTIIRAVTLEDICARLKGKCQMDGFYFLTDEFREAYRNGTVDFPYWNSPWGPLDLSRSLGNVNVTDNGRIRSAQAVRLIFNFRRNTEHVEHLSFEWEKHYVIVAPDLDYGDLDFAFSASHSLGNELDKGTKGDIGIFAMTFALMIFYAAMVTAGGDCVSSRALLALGGVLAAVLGIFGSLGLIGLLGVPFVNIVGCMPFLVLGIGVDDMFLMMAAWSGTLGNRELTIPERLATTFRSAGIGITITSLTDGLAFVVGGFTSVFQSVRNFCIYTGTAVFICYVCNLTFFGGCMALHGRRVYSARHTLTCRKVKDKGHDKLNDEDHSCFFRRFCGGSVPEEVGADESLCEKVPRVLLPRLVLWTPMKAVILFCFAGFLGVSIWGAMGLKQGLLLKHLVLPNSFYYKYNTWEEDIFGITFPVSFVIDEPLNYANFTVAKEVNDLLNKARDDPAISNLGSYCWLIDYFFSAHFNPSSHHAFVQNLRNKFLPENPHYLSDLVIDEDFDVIVASRCHVYTESVRESTEQTELMIRLREMADAASIKVFAYQPVFVFFEQYAEIVPNTKLTVGATLAAMVVVSFILLAHPLMVFLVLFNVVMIVTGIFGFMALWGLSLSSVTMIHLIMSVGFSVDFSAHVCAAYMTSLERTRQERARHALTHASGPILNGGISSFVGIVVLVISESFIFRSFFKIMVLVILFGVLHAVFLMPVILSLIGPELSGDAKDPRNSTIVVKAREKTANWKPPCTLNAISLSDNKNEGKVSDWLGGVTAFENQGFTTHM